MATGQGQLVALTLAGFGVALAGTAFCIVQIYTTAQLPEGDGTGMQWVILTPLAMLFLFVVVPGFITGLRSLRLIKLAREASRAPAAGHERANGVVEQDQVRRATESEAGASGGIATAETVSVGRVLPGRGWLIALGLLALYLLAPFVLAPLFGLFMDD